MLPPFETTRGAGGAHWERQYYVWDQSMQWAQLSIQLFVGLATPQLLPAICMACIFLLNLGGHLGIRQAESPSLEPLGATCDTATPSEAFGFALPSCMLLGCIHWCGMLPPGETLRSAVGVRAWFVE